MHTATAHDVILFIFYIKYNTNTQAQLMLVSFTPAAAIKYTVPPCKNTSHFSTSFEMQILFKVSVGERVCWWILQHTLLVKKSIQFFLCKSFSFNIKKKFMYRKNAIAH